MKVDSKGCQRRKEKAESRKLRHPLQQLVAGSTPSPLPVNWHLPSGRGGVKVTPCGLRLDGGVKDESGKMKVER